MSSPASTLIRQGVRFGAVGSVGFLVDLGLFNALLFAGTGLWHVHGAAVLAKTASTAAAIAVNWIGNRLWTFRSLRRADVAREAAEFVIASIAGSMVALACLGISHYVLHLTSVAADNVSANVVGLVLGSAVRFVVYRWWVFGTGHISTQTVAS
jgi:putative flippase GtrA